MKIKVTTTINTDEASMWKELQKVSSLLYVSYPLIIFRPQKGCLLPEIWSMQTAYTFKLFFLIILPLGSHCIEIVELEKDKNSIRSQEHGKFINSWKHRITFKQNSTGNIDYMDEVEIDAGLLTLPVWMFSHVFYRYRQYRWRKFFTSNQLRSCTG